MTQVIIDDILPRTQLIAAAAQTVFNTNWTADVATDVDVYARADGVEPDDVAQIVDPSLYAITFIGSQATVRVTFLSGRTLDDIITIVRNTPSTRENLYINTNFTPSMLNQDFSVLTLVDQQNQMYDQLIAPHYNLDATIDPIIDVILPILGENQVWVMNGTRTKIIAYDVPEGGGLAPDTATYLVQTPNSNLPNAQALNALASGLLYVTTGTGVIGSRTLQGTVDQIGIANATGVSGNPTVFITPNPILGGTEGMGLPQGSTGQRPVSPNGTELRFNTSLSELEYWDGSGWVQLVEDPGVIVISGTTNQIDVDSTDPNNPVLSLSATLDFPGTFTVQGSTAIDGVINDGTLATATASNLASAGATKTYIDTHAAATVVVADDTTTNATMYPIWVTASSGSLPLKVTSTKFNFNPSTGTLTSTIYLGLWHGTAIGEIYGGTNQTTYALGDTLYSSATNTLSKLAGNITTAKQYLSQTGNGAVSAAPSWATIGGSDITGAALTKIDDTNVTLVLGGTPTTALLRAASLTLGWTGQLSVARGGTGLAAITAHYLPIGNGTSALTLLAPNATSGIPLISQGSSADPAYGTAVVAGGGTGIVTTTPYSVICAGTTATGAFQSLAALGAATTVLTSNGPGALPSFQAVSGSGTVNSGTANQIAYYATTGTAVSGLTGANSAMVVTGSTGVPVMTSTMTNGQVVIGSTGGTPVVASLTAGTNITITPGAGTISIASTASGGVTWANISGTSQAAAINTGYVVGNASATTVTLPATAALGSIVAVQGKGAAGWILAANTGQTIQMGASPTSTAGSLTSANRWDSVEVVCVTADTTWAVRFAFSSGLTVA